MTDWLKLIALSLSFLVEQINAYRQDDNRKLEKHGDAEEIILRQTQHDSPEQVDARG